VTVSGTLQINGDLSSTALLSVTGAGSRFEFNAATLNVPQLNIQSGGSVQVDPGGSRVVRVSALVIDNTSRMDLNDNLLIVDYSGTSPANSLQSLVSSGFAGGLWSGWGVTSTAARSTSHSALGLAEASDLGSTTSFAGQPIDSTTVVVRFTVAGDTNLDRSVDIADLGTIASNWQKAGQRWSQGNVDLSADGLVDVSDLGILASNWQTTLPAAPVTSLAATVRGQKSRSSRIVNLVRTES
jgi:hypothetical protein